MAGQPEPRGVAAAEPVGTTVPDVAVTPPPPPCAAPGDGTAAGRVPLSATAAPSKRIDAMADEPPDKEFDDAEATPTPLPARLEVAIDDAPL